MFAKDMTSVKQVLSSRSRAAMLDIEAISMERT